MGRREPVGDAAPEAGGVEDVGLVDDGELAAPLLRRLEGGAQRPLDLRLGVGARVVRHVADRAVLAKVDAYSIVWYSTVQHSDSAVLAN